MWSPERSSGDARCNSPHERGKRHAAPSRTRPATHVHAGPAGVVVHSSSVPHGVSHTTSAPPLPPSPLPPSPAPPSPASPMAPLAPATPPALVVPPVAPASPEAPALGGLAALPPAPAPAPFFPPFDLPPVLRPARGSPNRSSSLGARIEQAATHNEQTAAMPTRFKTTAPFKRRTRSRGRASSHRPYRGRGRGEARPIAVGGAERFTVAGS
jgi:hypothetical protein